MRKIETLDSDLEGLKAYVKQHSPVKDHDWEAFQKLLKTFVFEKGEFFTREGQEDHSVGFVCEGIFKHAYSDNEGNEYIWIFPKKGEPTACYASLIFGGPAVTNIAALAPSRLIVVPYKELVRTFDSSMEWQRFGRKVAESYYVIKEIRDRELVSMDATTRYQIFVERHAQWVNHIPLNSIAAYLGITPVSLSRIRSKLLASKT